MKIYIYETYRIYQDGFKLKLTYNKDTEYYIIVIENDRGHIIESWSGRTTFGVDRQLVETEMERFLNRNKE